MPKELRGNMLQSQLYGRARDLCKDIPNNVIQSDTGTKSILQAIYKREPLSVVSEVYLGVYKPRCYGKFKNSESRFDAQLSKFNATSDTSKIPEALTAFMLL